MPQAQEIEKAVLGSILINPDYFEIVADVLTQESFYVTANKVVFSCMESLNRKGIPISLLILVQELKSMGELENVGGAYYLTTLDAHAVSAAALESYIRVVYEKYLSRKLISIGGEIIQQGYSEETDVFELMAQTSKAVFDISMNHNRSSYTKADKLIVESLKQTEEQRNRPDELTGVPTGYRILDRVTNGWQATDLIILAARPSVGKTAFALNLARNAAMHPTKKTSVGFFSLEMSSHQLIKRVQSTESKIPLDKIVRARLDDEEMRKLHSASSIIANSGLYFDDTSALTLYELRSKARKMVQKDGVGLIIVDYLHLMSGTDERKNQFREQEISQISRGLKAMAKDLKVPVIALSQLSRDIEKRKSPKPMLSDLRESGAIEQDADLVIFLSRSDYQKEEGEMDPQYSDDAEIKIAKNRNGQLITIPFYSLETIVTWMDEEQYQKHKALGPGSWKPAPQAALFENK